MECDLGKSIVEGVERFAVAIDRKDPRPVEAGVGRILDLLGDEELALRGGCRILADDDIGFEEDLRTLEDLQVIGREIEFDPVVGGGDRDVIGFDPAGGVIGPSKDEHLHPLTLIFENLNDQWVLVIGRVGELVPVIGLLHSGRVQASARNSGEVGLRCRRA